MKYISAEEVKKHWGILDFELLKYIQDSLPAYDRTGLRTITDSQVVYEKEESIDDLRTRFLLRESKHQSRRVEKNNSAEYAINALRLIKAGLLDSELPPPEMYNAEKIRQRVEERIIEEYDQLPSFPVVPPGRRLISAELNDSDLHTLLDEIKTFQFKIEDMNEFGRLHGLKLIDEAEDSPQADATAGLAPAALPDGNTIIRKGHALTHANVVKRNYPNLTAKEAAQEINARLAAENLERYSEKHLMRIINKLGFKKGKSGRPPEK
jgi:hypothetical protein